MCLFAKPIHAISQNIKNLHIEKIQDYGLTNEIITCINQDKNGFMWFGTEEGIFQYDGYNFKAFRNIPGDPTTLISSSIVALYPENNNLWVGTLSGLGCIDINTNTIKNFSPGTPLQINTILPNGKDGLWIAAKTGLYQFNKTTGRWKKISLMGGDVPVNWMTDDRQGHLYLSSFDGVYCYTKISGACKFRYFDIPRFPKISEQKKNIGHRVNVGRSAMDQKGNLWMASFEAGLIRLNTQTGKVSSWSHQSNDVHLLPYFSLSSVFVDQFDNVWIAAREGGLTIFNPSKNEFINYPIDWQSENKISDGVISIFQDRSGIVWIGTENGIFKYDPHHLFFQKTDIRLKTLSGLSGTFLAPQSMLKEREGVWWLGTYQGVLIYDEKTGIAVDGKDKVGFENQPLYAVFNIIRDKQNEIWLSAKNLLVKSATKAGTKPEFFGTPEIKSKIRALYIDSQNNIWLGTHSDGIFRFDPVTKKIVAFHYNEGPPGSRLNEIRTFYELGKDSLLVGGLETGLLLLHTNTGRFERLKPGDLSGIGQNFSINAIYKSSHDLWIGTQDNGLLQISDGFKKIVNITPKDGLPSMAINSIQCDRYNNLWLATSSGVVRIQLPGKKITVFDKRDGIQNLHEMNVLVVDSNEHLSVSGRGAFYTFDNAGTARNSAPPAVLITGMHVFDKDYTIQKGETIVLDYNQNYFSFDYVALNYTQSRLNNYAYKMDGLDRKWNFAGSTRRVSYANLSEGTYTFSVKACNNEGVWNNAPAKLVLIIKPPFWHRWWFFSLVVVIIASVIGSLYVYNIKQLKIRLSMRDKIARDLHDDIGSTLSGINIFSNIALQKMSPGQPGLDLMEKISDKSHKSLEALSDIVWSIDTRNDDMEDFVMKANEYLSVLDAQNIACDFSISHDAEQLKLGMIARRELYMIFKEAVCNASKYAGCTFIKISLTRHKDTCTLCVSDNGKGFDIDAVSSGNGLYNMKERAKKMKGDIRIESEKSKGTIVTLNFNITRFR